MNASKYICVASHSKASLVGLCEDNPFDLSFSFFQAKLHKYSEADSEQYCA